VSATHKVERLGCKCHVEAQYIGFNGNRRIVQKFLMSFLCLLILISSVSDHATEQTGNKSGDKLNCAIWFTELKTRTTKKKLHGLSPRANYTDRATAACRRSDCQLLRIEGATWSA
jgi:hypothetical protein